MLHATRRGQTKQKQNMIRSEVLWEKPCQVWTGSKRREWCHHSNGLSLDNRTPSQSVSTVLGGRPRPTTAVAATKKLSGLPSHISEDVHAQDQVLQGHSAAPSISVKEGNSFSHYWTSTHLSASTERERKAKTWPLFHRGLQWREGS